MCLCLHLSASLIDAEHFALRHKVISRWALTLLTLLVTLAVTIVQRREAVEKLALKNENDICKLEVEVRRNGTHVCLHGS